MNDARDRLLSSPIYSDAVKRLIGKLLVPDHLTSNERKECCQTYGTKPKSLLATKGFSHQEVSSVAQNRHGTNSHIRTRV